MVGIVSARLWTAAGLLAFASLSTPASAATCSVNPQSVNFGNYDPFSPSSLDGVGNVSVDCDGLITFTISLGTGNGSYDGRFMLNGEDRLYYNLYIDPVRLLVWGDGNGSSSTVSRLSLVNDFAIYGRVPARQNIGAGSYTDTIVVTVSY